MSWFFTQIRDTNLYHEFETNDVVSTLNDLLLQEHVSFGILGRDIAARHTNLRQHLRGHPALEGLRLRQLRREYQRVQAGLVDEDDELPASHAVEDGVTFR